jgi:hypothetical protein
MLFFLILKTKSTMFHPKLTNVTPFVESKNISSKPKYDIITTQDISTRRFKTLYEMREKHSKHIKRSVQFLEGSNDLSLPSHMKNKY